MIAPITWRDGIPTLAVDVRTLRSGLEVIVHTDRSVPLVAVWMGYRVGSSDEGDGTSGFAHLFEHMFKNSLHLAGRHHYEILRADGATDANAQTGTDRTVYHQVMPRAALETALWIESDRMGFFLPGVSDDRLARQIAVVQSERRQRYENAPFGPERFAAALGLYPVDHPLRHLTIGRHADIAAATVDRVAAFYRTWYVPANATLVLAGDLDGDEAAALCERWFGDFPSSVRPARRVWPMPSIAGPIRVDVDDELAALGRVRRSWIGPCHHTNDAAALEALAVAWALPGSGRLWQRLVHELRRARRVSVSTSAGRLGGEIHVVVDLNSDVATGDVQAVLDEELALLASAPLPERAVVRAGVRQEAALLWRLDGVNRRAALLLAAHLSTGSTHGIADMIERSRAVTVADVTAAAAQWLRPDRMISVTTRPTRGTPTLVAARAHTTVTA